MTGKRISELTRATSPLSLAEIVPAVQTGTTVGLSVAQIRGGTSVSILDFGARGDGVADDTDAFRAMHSFLLDQQRNDSDKRFTVILPPGHYRYRWNRWLWGLRSITVSGYGAQIQCVNDSQWNFHKYPLVTNRSPFQAMGPHDERAVPHGRNFGFHIHSTDPGSTFVSLKNSSVGSSLRVGGYALVMSYDQQFAGYPPNCRYFDYVRVLAVDGHVVWLDRPLRYRHSDQYPELGGAASRDNNPENGTAASSIGRARIVPIDRDDVPFALQQTFLGIKVLRNPNLSDDPVQYLLAQGVYSFTARDCELISFVPSLGHDFRVENSSVVFCEPDKIVNSVSFENCRIDTLTQATGVNLLTVRSSTISTKANVQARVVSFDSCEFGGATKAGDYKCGIDLVGFAPTKSISVVNSIFFGKKNPTDTAVAPTGTPANAFTSVPLSSPIAIMENKTVAVPLADKRMIPLLRVVDIGDIVLVGTQDGSDVSSDGRFGRLRDVRSDSLMAYLDIDFSRPVTAHDHLIIPRVRKLICKGNTYININSTAPITYNSTIEHNVINSEHFKFLYSSDFDTRIVSLWGRVRKISINVTQPYTHFGRELFLHIKRHRPTGSSSIQIVNLAEPGYREVGYKDIFGARSGDLLQSVWLDEFVWSIHLSHAEAPSGRTVLPKGAVDQLAVYTICFETENPFEAYA